MVNHDSCRYKNNHVIWENQTDVITGWEEKPKKSTKLYDVKERQDELQMGTKLDFPEGRK